MTSAVVKTSFFVRKELRIFEHDLDLGRSSAAEHLAQFLKIFRHDGTLSRSKSDLMYKLPIHPKIATFGDAKFICQSVGSKIATISSLNFNWNAIISSIVTKVRCFM